MEKYNYTYEGRAITKKTFEDSVPKTGQKTMTKLKVTLMDIIEPI